jgi:hypothetical protein
MFLLSQSACDTIVVTRRYFLFCRLYASYTTIRKLMRLSIWSNEWSLLLATCFVNTQHNTRPTTIFLISKKVSVFLATLYLSEWILIAALSIFTGPAKEQNITTYSTSMKSSTFVHNVCVPRHGQLVKEQLVMNVCVDTTTRLLFQEIF